MENFCERVFVIRPLSFVNELRCSWNIRIYSYVTYIAGLGGKGVLTERDLEDRYIFFTFIYFFLLNIFFSIIFFLPSEVKSQCLM